MREEGGKGRREERERGEGGRGEGGEGGGGGVREGRNYCLVLACSACTRAL